MTARRHTTVTRTQGANAALKDGTVRPRTFAFDFVEVPVLIDAFRRMVRGREFDICEMSITTYVTARQYGKRFTALPVFIVRGFHHGAIMCNTRIVTAPKDLEGKRVGVNRGYTVTTGVWARGALASDYGVDLNSITWVLSGDEHVAEFQPPRNVVPVEPGKTLAEMLVSGEIAAAIGVDVSHPEVRPLIPNAQEAALRALRERGEYPINHLIVVKDELLEAHGDLGPDVFDAFVRAKQVYVERLKSGAIAEPAPIDELHRRVMEITGDPLPYGIEPNRVSLDALVRYAVDQHIIERPSSVEALFAAGTHDLRG